MRGARRDWDAIVVGLGGIGCGALYWLARELRGDVLGIEQYELGHDRGASQDWSRIIRYSYHRPHYVRFARSAYEAWRVVEEESRETLVVPVGGLDLFPEGGAIPLDDYTVVFSLLNQADESIADTEPRSVSLDYGDELEDFGTVNFNSP